MGKMGTFAGTYLSPITPAGGASAVLRSWPPPSPLLAVAVLGDLQERRLRGGRGPQRAGIAARAPAGLIDMHRALIQHPVLQMAVRASQGV
jgi:hypothetical protein